MNILQIEGYIGSYAHNFAVELRESLQDSYIVNHNYNLVTKDPLEHAYRILKVRDYARDAGVKYLVELYGLLTPYAESKLTGRFEDQLEELISNEERDTLLLFFNLDIPAGIYNYSFYVEKKRIVLNNMMYYKSVMLVRNEKEAKIKYVKNMMSELGI
ncbi:MAG: hypothetical protein QXR05_07140 [Candidatus Methanomethylicia archaeon]